MPYYINYYSRIRNDKDKTVEELIAEAAGKIVTKVKTEFNPNEPEQYPQSIRIRNAYGHALDAWYNYTVANEESFGYATFQIPKRSGGMRTIHAPNPELKQAQQMLDALLRKTLRLLPHNAVHSYMKNRNTKSAMEVHRKNHSRWFLKIDIKDYFNNCTYEKVLNELGKLYPMVGKTNGAKFRRCLKSVAFLGDALPQGSPASPVLSNLFLIEFDYDLTEMLKKRTDAHFRYTRYADDLIISADKEFNFNEITTWISDYLLVKYSLEINREKTRFGSFNGRNWNLGLMYNNNYDITVGYKNKHLMKNKIHNLFRDEPSDKTSSEYGVWCLCKSRLVGLLNYYRYIEPDYFNNLIGKYKAKGYDI